jgi:hypothetical protein
MLDLSQLLTAAAAFVAAEFGLAVVVGRWLARAGGSSVAPPTPGRTSVVVVDPSSPIWN